MKQSKSYLIYVGMSSITLGVLLMAIINWVANEDFAATLAGLFRFGNGIVVAGILAGLTGILLGVSSAKRIAWFTGAVCGIGTAALLWFFGSNYRWLIDLILISVFGPSGKAYTALIMVMIFFGVIRVVSDNTALAVEALIRRAGSKSRSAAKTEVRIEESRKDKMTTNKSAASS